MTSSTKERINILQIHIALSSNGRTADSDSVNLGSNPGKAANKEPPDREVFLLGVLSLGETKFGIAVATGADGSG